MSAQKPKSTKQPPRFEEAMQELETLVQAMETGSLSLEESLQNYQRGAELLQYCQAALERAREQIRIFDGTTLTAIDQLNAIPDDTPAES